ncbi:hypothetical protein SAMN00790413_00316 [Deinococcus hopiensis KR-140]|uniref:Uncharacterized protein n=1 Tax=Deinococcus hopiensis KR-140 TaxID=695939 RepID=A0A1W1V7R7_9DEIO|nr:hypothetical protein SAMN00790413_00316 [Deinococcus hopiensis KR-140]
MRLVRANDAGVELEVDGEVLWSTYRIDRYVKPKSWLRPREEVEIWEMANGRQLRLSRVHSSQPWTLRWK